MSRFILRKEKFISYPVEIAFLLKAKFMYCIINSELTQLKLVYWVEFNILNEVGQ